MSTYPNVLFSEWVGMTIDEMEEIKINKYKPKYNGQQVVVLLSDDNIHCKIICDYTGESFDDYTEEEIIEELSNSMITTTHCDRLRLLK